VRKKSLGGLLDRTVQRRDARVFVLALEGEPTGAEFKYFEALSDLLDSTRVHLHQLPTDPQKNDSAPRHVLDRLKEFLARYEPRTTRDEYWIIVDVDHRRPKELRPFVRDARSAGYKLAVSNPCFELWLILHHDADLSFLVNVRELERSQAAKDRLKVLRAAEKADLTLPAVWQAHARASERDAGRPWPDEPGTHVYRLIDALTDAGALSRPS
jgi:hypothetical protein